MSAHFEWNSTLEVFPSDGDAIFAVYHDRSGAIAARVSDGFLTEMNYSAEVDGFIRENTPWSVEDMKYDFCLWAKLPHGFKLFGEDQ